MDYTRQEVVDYIKLNITETAWADLKNEFGYPKTIKALNEIFEQEDYSFDKEIGYTYYLDEGFIDLIITDILKANFDPIKALEDKCKADNPPTKKQPNPYDFATQSEYEKAVEDVNKYNLDVADRKEKANKTLRELIVKRQEQLALDEQEKQEIINSYTTKDWQQEGFKKYAKEHPLKAQVVETKDKLEHGYNGDYYVRATPIVKEDRVHIKG